MVNYYLLDLFLFSLGFVLGDAGVDSPRAGFDDEKSDYGSQAECEQREKIIQERLQSEWVRAPVT